MKEIFDPDKFVEEYMHSEGITPEISIFCKKNIKYLIKKLSKKGFDYSNIITVLHSARIDLDTIIETFEGEIKAAPIDIAKALSKSINADYHEIARRLWYASQSFLFGSPGQEYIGPKSLAKTLHEIGASYANIVDVFSKLTCYRGDDVENFEREEIGSILYKIGASPVEIVKSFKDNFEIATEHDPTDAGKMNLKELTNVLLRAGLTNYYDILNALHKGLDLTKEFVEKNAFDDPVFKKYLELSSRL
jgi:hypothetical protein